MFEIQQIQRQLIDTQVESFQTKVSTFLEALEMQSVSLMDEKLIELNKKDKEFAVEIQKRFNESILQKQKDINKAIEKQLTSIQNLNEQLQNQKN